MLTPMKKWYAKLMAPVLLCAVIAIAVSIGAVCFAYISQRIDDDSAVHLREIYGQVNSSFGAFVDRNWGLLDEWGSRFELMDLDRASVNAMAERERERWGFSEFYFLAADGTSMTPAGERGRLDLSADGLAQNEPVLAGQTTSSGQEVTVFAVPVEPGRYEGFDFDAIAVSYTNVDLANSLNVDAFSGKANCFVIHEDGSVLLSTRTGGNVFSNYLSYLQAASDLTDEELSAIQTNWAGGESDLVRCRIGDVASCILYQPIGYQDLVLLSAVPQSAVSAGFLSVQKTTVTVLVSIFLLIGTAAIGALILRGRRLSQQSRTELQYRERMFDVLSNSVDDIFLMLDTQDQRVDYVSPNIERLLGIHVEDARANIRVMEKCTIRDNVVIPRQELEAIPLNGSRHWECEYMHQGTGERRWYRMTVYRMSIQDMEKYIFVLSDRTLEQRMNQQLQGALDAAQSANAAKSNFLSNMSHDIRTPMNAIVGFSLLLEKEADDPEKVREYTRKITASSHHLLSLINDVLDMSKIESGKTSLNVDRFSLPELLEELNIILLPQAKAKKQTFTVHVQGAPPEQILGDKLRLNQILINLLSNAIKYTPEGGRIEFLVAEADQPVEGQYVKLRFVVRDNGIGMSEQFQREVFVPFSREISSVTNTVQGTGLGMAITKNLVDLMGGVIQVESKLGQGSTFTVELTFALPEQEERDTWYRQKITRMLVVDDEEEICLDIRELMRDTGVDVSIRTDGASAVEAAVQASSSGAGFHVILLDWKMPGMDGVQTARAIRERVGHDVPILVLTSYDWSEIEEQARAAGINAFMPKPFFASTFWQAIKPLFTQEQSHEVQAEPPAENVLAGRLFLVAEDNEMNAEILTDVLAMEDARCEVAVNGKEAVEMFERSEPGRYDMILMDVQMPVMNGYEATRAIRAGSHPEAATIPIVAMTANTFAEDVRNALASGMDAHLAKPIDLDAMRQVVGKLLGPPAGPQDEQGEG